MASVSGENNVESKVDLRTRTSLRGPGSHRGSRQLPARDMSKLNAGQQQQRMQRAIRAKKIRRQENSQEELAKRFILEPTTTFKTVWDIVISFMVLYVAIELPLSLSVFAFGLGQNNTFDRIVTAIFLIDIGVECRTAYFNDTGDVVTDGYSIFLRYAFQVRVFGGLDTHARIHTYHSWNHLT